MFPDLGATRLRAGRLRAHGERRRRLESGPGCLSRRKARGQPGLGWAACVPRRASPQAPTAR
eukprot:15423493-Alexandrium_andersonii.AAC.1